MVIAFAERRIGWAMNSHEVDGNGICSTCTSTVNDCDVLKCNDCRSFYHAICGTDTLPFGPKSNVSSFKKFKCENFVFCCDSCMTRRENQEASTLKEQVDELKDSIKELAAEFKAFKAESRSTVPPKGNVNSLSESWSDKVRNTSTKNSSLCLKSSGKPVDLNFVKKIAVDNSIQVSGTSVKTNGDVYVNLSNVENRDKIVPLLAVNHPADNIVKLKSKLPTISILNVETFISKEDFISKVKQQNPAIKELIELGSEFSIAFVRSDDNSETTQKYYQVVARIGDDIREQIKLNNNKIYVDLNAHRIVDLFYIKRCNWCQTFGHYQEKCQSETFRCGFCCGPHASTTCLLKNQDVSKFTCPNCKDVNKQCSGHSRHWFKCPTYLEAQNKMKKSIPFYSSKN